MSLTFNNNDRVKLAPTITADLDPSDATIALLIDGTEHPCTWTAEATQDGSLWTRPATTTGYLAGPAVPDDAVDGATVLDYGLHTVEVVVTTGPTVKASELPNLWITR